MRKKYQVFISSTYKDLIEERAAVSQCLLECECIPVGMEQFPASGMGQMEYITKMLDDSDYYILILAGRYGSLDTDGIGFTEKEYDYAKSIGLPVMSFVYKDISELPDEKCEATATGKSLLNKFREKVCKDKLVKMYSNSDDLKYKVAASLFKCIQDFQAVGWVRADSINGVIPVKETENADPYQMEYEHLKMEIVEALSMYRCYYHSPVDLATIEEHKLPEIRKEGSHRLRELASKTMAFATVYAKDGRIGAVDSRQLSDAAGCLYGLSNSFTTPYNSALSPEELRTILEWENRICEILGLNENGA